MVFCTSVDPMNKEHKDPNHIDLEALRLAWYKQKKWKRHPDTVYWVDINLALKKGFKFYQTRSNAIIFYDAFPAYCIPKVVVMETGEVKYEKVYASPRHPPKISLKHDWMKELDSEVAGGSKDSQQIQPKWKTQWSRTGRPVSEQPSGSFTVEIRKDILLGRESTNSRTVKPVDGLPSSQSCVPVSVKRSTQDKDADENADADQIRTGRPVESEQSIGLFTQREEIDIDSEVSGFPHAVVKQAENFRIRELVKKIESHPHREALQADLQQNNVHNPFGGDAKAMIREMGNVELFEFCETIPKVQCSECLLYWNLGLVYCSCGQFLVESESRRKFHRWRLDALAIPHNVIRMGSLRGARHGKIEAQKRAFCGTQRAEEMHQNNFWKNSRSFPTRSSISWIATQIGWTEQKCIEWDELAIEDHTSRLTPEEKRRNQGQWCLTLNKSGKNATMRLRSDFRAAVTIKNRLHGESGEERAEPIPFQQCQRWHPSSSSDSWWSWDTSKSWWSSWVRFFFEIVCCSRFRLQLTAICCNRREV